MSSSLPVQCFVMVLICLSVRCEFYDSYSGKEINRTRYDELNRLGLVPYCAIEVSTCDAYAPRRMDGGCNNPRYPSRGTALTPYRRMLPPVFGAGGTLRMSKSGKPLPLVRPLRVDLMSDGRRPSDRFTHMVTNYFVLTTGDITSVHDTVNYVSVTRTCCQPAGRQNPQCIPVEVKDDDLHLRRSNVRCMNLTRAVTYQRLGCISDDVQPERVNTATPMLDLSALYGHEERGARRGREFKWGRLRAEMLNGKEWPPSGGPVCLNNVLPRETRCHDSPMYGANSVLGLNLMFMWFYRSHNAIADALRKHNPCWDDDRLYYTAREINIAYYNQMLYYELLPELFGWNFLVHHKVVFPTLGHVEDYDPTLEPRVSIDYVAATRWFHTMQAGNLNLYKPDGRLYGSVAVVDFILRTGALPLDGNIEGMTQGSFRQPGGGVDDVLDPDVGERILGRLQFASDVVSSDILKSRDLGLPPYNHYRRACGLAPAESFKDLLGWMDRKQVEIMATYYEHPDDIDVIAAILAEKPMLAAALGPTLACIMAEQLRYWRRSDRFWFEHTGHPRAFTQPQLLEIRKMTLGKLFCQHGDSVNAVQPRAFLLPGPGNEITDCREYEMPDLSVFRDDRCYPHPTSNVDRPLPNYAQDFVNPTGLKSTPYLPVDLFNLRNPGYSKEDVEKLLNFNIDTTNHNSPSIGPISVNKGNPTQQQISSILYPNPDPKVAIYPNADPKDTEPEKIPRFSPNIVSIPGYTNIDSKSRSVGREFPNIYTGVRNQNYLNANPFY